MINSRDTIVDFNEKKKINIEIPYEIGTIVTKKNNLDDLAVICQYRLIIENNKSVVKIGLSFDIYNDNPKAEEEINLDIFMQKYIKSNKIIVKNIGKSELVLIPEISEYYKTDKTAIFNKNLEIFKDSNYDVDIFLEKYQESRNLEKYEIRCLKALCEMSMIFKLQDDVILGPGRSSCSSCLFKIEDSKWIMWETDERRGFSNPKLFLNVYDACINIINSNVLEEQKEYALKHLNFLLSQNDDEQSLINFANNMHYVYLKNKIKTLKKINNKTLL